MKAWIVMAALVASVGQAAGASDLQAALEAQLKANALGHGIPAQAVLVMHNDDVVYRGTTGTTEQGGSKAITRETPFPIYSVSKLFTNTLVMQLAEEGKIDLSAPASKYVTNLPPAWRAIRVEQFMDHVSGVPDFFDPKALSRPFPPTLDAVFAKLSDVPVLSAPDVRTSYAGSNYLVLEAALQNITHKPYKDLLTERILKPLGMRHTYLEPSKPPAGMVASYHAEHGRAVVDPPVAWPDYAIAEGCIVSTLDDLQAFLSAVANGKLVSRPALLTFWHPYRFSNGNDGYFAAGWDYREEGNWHQVGHDGGTKVRVRLVFGKNLDDHYLIIYLTNGNADDVWSGTLVDSIQGFTVPR